MVQSQLSEEEDKVIKERSMRKDAELKLVSNDREVKQLTTRVEELEAAKRLLSSHLSDARATMDSLTAAADKAARRTATLEQQLQEEQTDKQRARDQVRRLQVTPVDDVTASYGGYSASGLTSAQSKRE